MVQESILSAARARERGSLREIADAKKRASAPACELTSWSWTCSVSTSTSTRSTVAPLLLRLVTWLGAAKHYRVDRESRQN